MTSPAAPTTDLWWTVPGALAGTSMPFIHPDRHETNGAPLDAFRDELPELWQAGIRSMVCLLNMRSAEAAYVSAGFSFLCLPLADGFAPSPEQFQAFMDFTGKQNKLGRPVAVHCVAGMGRTGTLLAGHLVASGRSVDDAISHVRGLRPGAVESFAQIRFLHNLAKSLEGKKPA